MMKLISHISGGRSKKISHGYAADSATAAGIMFQRLTKRLSDVHFNEIMQPQIRPFAITFSPSLYAPYSFMAALKSLESVKYPLDTLYPVFVSEKIKYSSPQLQQEKSQMQRKGGYKGNPSHQFHFYAHARRSNSATLRCIIIQQDLSSATSITFSCY